MGVRSHERNVTDEQMRACAATSGVVCINGVGLFLGENDSSTAALVRAVDYAVNVVGPEHVGLGLDYVFDREELDAYLAALGETFPDRGGYAAHGSMRFVSPLQLRELTAALLDLGYPEQAVRGILGENMLRVASSVW